MNKQMHISNGNKRILQIAVPSIISNITVPLLGLVDVTIVGHLGSARLHRSHCCRWHAVQHHLLDIRLSTDGHQRHDFPSIRTT